MAKEQKIEDLLTRGVAEVIDKEHLKKRLLGGEKLRVKLGIDPTSPNIHLGRSVVLLKLRDFQELGCKIVIIVGDFTGVIGDTSDKESERPMLAAAAIETNMKTYTEQMAKLIDLGQAEVHYNSTWLDKLKYEDIGKQADAFSLAEFIARENIKIRLDAGKRVSLREVFYPLMQGFDSVATNADVELGGTDQRFNLLAGRRMQEVHGQRAQDILMTNLILGTDNRKMSSSYGNTINLFDAPNNMFGKIMSIPDDLIVSYFVHCTRVPMDNVRKIEVEMRENGMNPRDAKIVLATEIVTLYHGSKEATTAEQYFIETFSKGVIPADIPAVRIKQNMTILELLSKAAVAESKADARRKIEQGGVSINNEKITAFTLEVTDKLDGAVVKVGKKDFFRIVVEK